MQKTELLSEILHNKTEYKLTDQETRIMIMGPTYIPKCIKNETKHAENMEEFRRRINSKIVLEPRPGGKTREPPQKRNKLHYQNELEASWHTWTKKRSLERLHWKKRDTKTHTPQNKGARNPERIGEQELLPILISAVPSTSYIRPILGFSNRLELTDLPS